MQGHGLVHTQGNLGEVLLGSRGSRQYRTLANQVNAQGVGVFRTANVLDWNIHRNDAFMAGALLGHNRFSVPYQNPRRDYIDNRNRDRPGRVTIREIAQVQRYAQLPPVDQRSRLRFADLGDRFGIGTAQPGGNRAPRGMHATMERIGNNAQERPGGVFASIPSRR